MTEQRRQWIDRVVATGGEHLRSILRRRVRFSQDVPDLVQEVYLRLLRMPAEAEISNPEAYVFTVAANLAREQAALTGRRERQVSHDAPEVAADLAFTPGFEEEIDRGQWAKYLSAMLSELSPKCRAAVVLHYRDGLSYAEAGERLGVSSNMVKKYVMQALAHCRKRMGQKRVLP